MHIYMQTSIISLSFSLSLSLSLKHVSTAGKLDWEGCTLAKHGCRCECCCQVRVWPLLLMGHLVLWCPVRLISWNHDAQTAGDSMISASCCINIPYWQNNTFMKRYSLVQYTHAWTWPCLICCAGVYSAATCSDSQVWGYSCASQDHQWICWWWHV